jgi:GTP cyclohydrolase II
VERIAIRTGQNPHNLRYLETKAGKLGHWMAAEDPG